ncbi:MAG: hypothetical protein AAGF78_15355, partial [Pseudomonadota bacterium]
MTPDFALHFTADEISLDQRRGTGWLTLGSASFRSGQFAGEIIALRAKGEAAARAAGIPFATKLVLPNDQIKFLKLREGDATRASVSMALEGATPYAISELLFDWKSEVGLTRIAAVARETLDEAAGFATEYNLAPAAFVALPEDGWEGTEAFFGPFEGCDAERDPVVYRRWEDGEDITDVSDAAETPTEGTEAVDTSAGREPDTEDVVDTLTAPTPGPAENAKATAVTRAEVDEPTKDAAPPAPGPTPDEKPGAPAIKLAVPTDPPREHTAPPVPSPLATSGPSQVTSAPAPLPEAAALAATLKPVEPAQGFAFQSQRSRSAQPVVPPPAPRPSVTPAVAETGLDGAAVVKNGAAKPRFLGLILTSLLILALLAVAAFASIREDGLAAIWQRLVPAAPDAPVTALAVPEAAQPRPNVVDIAPTPLSVVDPPR